MRNRFNRGNPQEVNLVTFRDLLMATVGLLLGVIAIIVVLINVEAKKKADDNPPERGDIRVEIVWPNEIDVDIDLWCRAPGDVPVGYSNKGGLVFNLVRDDLGSYADITGINYEVMFSRGAPIGEYACNVHWYGNVAGVKQVPVKMVVTYRKMDAGKDSKPVVIQSETVLLRQGEEVTMARWEIGRDKEIVEGSLNRVQIPLREYKGKRQ